MQNPQNSPPDGWDFSHSFLDDPAHLPPFVRELDSPLYGTSRRARAEDLDALLATANTPTTLLEKQAHTIALERVHGVVAAPAEGRNHLHGPARLVLPEPLLNRHWLWVGPPGVGKTTQGVLPMVHALLRDTERSLVVFDPKGDQFATIRELARRSGRKPRSVKRLNLSDPGGSVGWNPLRRGMTRAEALGVATTLVHAVEQGGSNDSPFWRNTSIDLLVDVVLGLDRDEREALTLPRVLEVVGMPRKELLAWLKEHGAHRFAAFLESGSHNAETCLADTAMRLVALVDEDLCAVLSHGELDLTSIYEKPTVLVVEMNETRLEPLRPIFNLLVQQLLDRAIEVAERRPDSRLPRPATLVIDELGSAIGAIPRFPTYLNTLRSRRVSIVGAVQGLSQLRALYREQAHAVVVGFSNKVYFSGVELDDAEYASLSSGMTTVEGSGGPGAMSVPRRLFLPDEIARPRRHGVLGRPATLFLAETPPFQAYLTPSYRIASLGQAIAAAGRARRRPRRRAPLRYEPHVPKARELPAPYRLKRLEDEIELRSASEAGQEQWREWRQQHGRDLRPLVRWAEQIRERGLKANDYLRARRECGCDDHETAMRYVDYLIARNRFRRAQRDSD